MNLLGKKNTASNQTLKCGRDEARTMRRDPPCQPLAAENLLDGCSQGWDALTNHMDQQHTLWQHT